MPNILLADVRKKIIADIKGDENRKRKNESLRRYDIYRKRQAQYIKEQLIREYSQTTVNEMRVISSINLGPRIVDKMASLYQDEPERIFTTRSGRKLSEQELKQIDELYKTDATDEKLKKSNRYYKLQQQAALQIIPREGIIQTRVLMPHHYDVIPSDGNPEVAEGYIINVYDRSLLYNQVQTTEDGGTNYLPQTVADGINQIIADPNDDQSAAGNRYIWWTKDYNFVTDGRGNIVNDQGQLVAITTQEQLTAISNPIGKLPFVDIACGKEYEFWVRQGNDIIDFALDFSVLLSDTAEINKRQGYSQAVIYSQEPPKDMLVGPNRVLHIKQNKDSELQPKFEWSNPAPDMQSALALLETYLSLFLTSQGLDPKTISGKGEGQKYTSGFDRLLAMIEMFEASKDDMAVYRRVEQQALDIKVLWSNLLQGATIKGGVEPLKPELQTAKLPEDLVVTVQYQHPEATQAKSEVEDSQIKLLESRLTTRKRAVMAIHGVDESTAEALIEEIDEEFELNPEDSDTRTNPDTEDSSDGEDPAG